VTLAGFAAATGRPVAAMSPQPPTPVNGVAPVTLNPGRGRPAAALLAAARDERAEHIGGRQVHDQAEAQALADAAFARASRRFVTLEASVHGDPRIRVGTHVAVAGAGRLFSNTFYVTRVLHRYDTAEGYVTELAAECAFIGE
jgi:phage protein D